MKAIISPYTRDFDWCEEIFPELSLCSLPVAGRAIAVHLLDLCSLLGTSDLLILDYCLDFALQSMLRERTDRWPVHFNYTGAKPAASVTQLLQRNQAFAAHDDLLIVHGPVLPLPRQPQELLTQTEPCDDDAPDGIFLRRDGKLLRYTGPQQRIASTADYFDLNFTLLTDSACYNLPGYSAENGVHTGMNVAIKQDCVISPPVILADNICLERDCTLANGVIIGANAIIDHHTSLDHAIVLGNTYVGQDMEIRDKIVVGQRIIDPHSGVYVDQSDMGVSADMHLVRHVSPTRLGEVTLLALLALTFLLPYLLLWPLRPLLSHRAWWRKLSLDRYPDIWRALLHHGHLVRRQPDSDIPFVFCASELYSVHATPAQQLLDDSYFRHHLSLHLMLRIVLHGSLRRLLANDCLE